MTATPRAAVRCGMTLQHDMWQSGHGRMVVARQCAVQDTQQHDDVTVSHRFRFLFLQPPDVSVPVARRQYNGSKHDGGTTQQGDTDMTHDADIMGSTLRYDTAAQWAVAQWRHDGQQWGCSWP